MKLSHLKYLFLGIAFWGIAIGILAKIIYPDLSKSFIEILALYTLITLLITFLIQWYIGGFPVKSPKTWFFLPLVSWIILLVWGNIEGVMIGYEPTFLKLFD